MGGEKKEGKRKRKKKERGWAVGTNKVGIAPEVRLGTKSSSTSIVLSIYTDGTVSFLYFSLAHPSRDIENNIGAAGRETELRYKLDIESRYDSVGTTTRTVHFFVRLLFRVCALLYKFQGKRINQ